MNDLLQQLVGMGPGIGAAAAGNGNAFASFMDGWQRAQQEDQQRKRMGQQDQRLMEQDRIAAEDRQNQMTRQQAADARLMEDRQRQQALQGLQIPGHLAELGATAEDPQGAQALIESAMPSLMKAFGQETMAMGQPAVEMAQRAITGRQKKQVEAFVDAALKTAHVADNPDADPELVNLPEHIARIVGKPTARLSELQSFAQLPVGKPAGKTRVPPMAGSFEDFTLRKYGDAPTPEQILEGRKLYNQSDDKPPQPQQGAYPPNVQRRIDAVIRGFDSQPIVKRTQLMSEGVNLANAISDTTANPADDMALIYAFAKVMDPESVVREGEYATVQKHSQSWASQFGFDVKRLFSNTHFLTTEARRNLKATLMTKFNAERKSYDNIRNEYGKRIDRITMKPGGIEELTDYGAAFPQNQGGGGEEMIEAIDPNGKRHRAPKGTPLPQGWKIAGGM